MGWRCVSFVTKRRWLAFIRPVAQRHRDIRHIFLLFFSFFFLNLDALHLAGWFLRLVGAEKLRATLKVLSPRYLLERRLPFRGTCLGRNKIFYGPCHPCSWYGRKHVLRSTCENAPSPSALCAGGWTHQMGIMEQVRARGPSDDATSSPYVYVSMACIACRLSSATGPCKLPWTTDSIRLPGSCSFLRWACQSYVLPRELWKGERCRRPPGCSPIASADRARG